MEQAVIFASLPGALLPWYDLNKRDLPWRADRDPYHIWISEIMLQQTRVEAVKGYYACFLEAFPSVADLANADDELLHKLWEGLGYYSRVRNMKKAAQIIMAEHHGTFPGEYDKILALPGIGEYTAGAICSIAFDMPTPAVDGNVLRVISRLSNDATPVDKSEFKKAVQLSLAKIYPAEAGAFTQALMELGATVCGPNRKPGCTDCPCRTFCQGYAKGTAHTLPVKTPKRGRRIEELTVFILRCADRYALEKRPGKGLLADLWQFPNAAGHLEMHQVITRVEEMGLHPCEITRQVEKKHVFTHVEWRMRGVYMDVKEINETYHWFTAQQIAQQAALPTAFRQFWDMVEDTEGR